MAENPYLADEVKQAFADDKAIFVAMIVDDAAGEHMFTGGIEDNVAAINTHTLQQFGAKKPLLQFDEGVVSWGFYFLGELKFTVIWATMYRAA